MVDSAHKTKLAHLKKNLQEPKLSVPVPAPFTSAHHRSYAGFMQVTNVWLCLSGGIYKAYTRTWRQWRESTRRDQIPLSLATALIRQTCSSLLWAHRRFINRCSAADPTSVYPVRISVCYYATLPVTTSSIFSSLWSRGRASLTTITTLAANEEEDKRQPLMVPFVPYAFVFGRGLILADGRPNVNEVISSYVTLFVTFSA